ncbi:hypothetical protein SDC9_180679 [bioreactor metagenome]|uniref:Uncharacterized protein n=1 Tax=bioreactor metagenome TaxID=1076179 RepID=A0A645H2E9_9ZZZZ
MEEMAVQKELITTPARIRLVVGTVLPTLAMRVTKVTAAVAPRNAAMGMANDPRVVYGH